MVHINPILIPLTRKRKVLRIIRALKQRSKRSQVIITAV